MQVESVIADYPRHICKAGSLAERVLREYEDWLSLHQGIEAAQVTLHYCHERHETCIEVYLQTASGMPATDARYMFGDHRACPSEIVELSKAAFSDWYTHQ